MSRYSHQNPEDFDAILDNDDTYQQWIERNHQESIVMQDAEACRVETRGLSKDPSLAVAQCSEALAAAVSSLFDFSKTA